MEGKLHSCRPLILLIAANILGMALIMIKEQRLDYNMAVLCGIMCGINIAAYLLINLLKMGDGYIFIIISMLSTVGVIMQTRIDAGGGIRQMKLYLFGTAVYFAVFLVYRLLGKKLWRMPAVCFFVSVVLFILTAVFGTVRYGSKNWIVIGGVSVQPSEVIRILFVLSLAAILTAGKKKNSENEKDEIKISNKKRLMAAAAVAYVNMGFLLLQREWGIAVLFFAIYLSFLYLYGKNKVFMLLNLAAALAGGLFGCKYMSHIRVRVSTWLDPFSDAAGKGYQITQSLFAIGAGGFEGRGIGNGSPYFIPVVSSDFIFSAICEEMGVLGATAVILLYFVLVYRGFKIALSSTNEFHKAVSIGLSVMLGVQTFIIIGGVTKLIPLTGITLPFISYGGSSMLTTFAALGILQAISAMRGEQTDEIE